MSREWDDPVLYPNMPAITFASWVRVFVRGLTLAAFIFGCFLFLLVIRLLERPIFKSQRPWTPRITQFVCRNALRIIGIGFEVQGSLMQEPGAVVANHSSWLDIFVLNAREGIYFVSKAEVATWPVIGWLAQATGTIFINRNPKEARAQKSVFKKRLLAGHKLLFFPEGTSTDTVRILPFKPTLFAAFYVPELRSKLHIQPVTVIYSAPPKYDARFYGWWGDMDFGTHLLQVLAVRSQGSVRVIYHSPVPVNNFQDRKKLAAHCESVIRSKMK